MLKLELEAEMLVLAEDSVATLKELDDFSTDTTLENFLEYSCLHEEARLTPKQQTLLALDIASSILQLRQTCWLMAPWNNKTIKFLISKTKMSKPSTLSGYTVGPFVEQHLNMTQSNPAVLFPEPDPKTALLELAILLLEIWHHKTLEMWAANADVKVETADHRRIAVIRWLELTSERLPPYHLTAVEQCLAICSGRLRYWDDDKFQKYYCENIIKPLLESCKAWVT
jgi:hypothetical protein